MPSTKRQRQRRERAVGEAVAAARLGEAARAHPDASLFFMDDAATETASKRARRAAKKKVATASPTESALLRKFEQRRKARPAHAGARAPKAAAAAAPPNRAYGCYRWGYRENRDLRDTIRECRPLPAAKTPPTMSVLVGNRWLEAPRADRSLDAR